MEPDISLFLTGPFKINGVPLRRVNQSYVIVTSTKVDISGVNVEKVDDKYFVKKAEKRKKKGGEFFEAEKKVSSSYYAVYFIAIGIVSSFVTLYRSYVMKKKM